MLAANVALQINEIARQAAKLPSHRFMRYYRREPTWGRREVAAAGHLQSISGNEELNGAPRSARGRRNLIMDECRGYTGGRKSIWRIIAISPEPT